MKLLGLNNRRFGSLVVVTLHPKRAKNGKARWVCRCDCGMETIVIGSNLTKQNGTRSCGCSRPSRRRKLQGKRFGRLVVVQYDEGKKNRGKWICRCDCGKMCRVMTSKLTSGWTKSCGCLWMDSVAYGNLESLIDKKFGRLIVLERVGTGRHRQVLYKCQCDCGNESVVAAGNLRSGHTTSCGCVLEEQKGVNHPCWKPELSDEDRKHIRPRIHKWRKEVFKRANFQCCVYYGKGNASTAHHKDGWNWNKKRRYDVTNGAALCEDCHLLFHSVYGNHNNTEKQFEEFCSGEMWGKEWMEYCATLKSFHKRQIKALCEKAGVE